MIKELRRSTRFPIEVALRYRLSCEVDWRKARTENISSTGVLFRCEQCAERGTRVDMNYLLSGSAEDKTGLEAVCVGEVVRSEMPLDGEHLPALAVKITTYRLSRGNCSRWELDDPFRESRIEE